MSVSPFDPSRIAGFCGSPNVGEQSKPRPSKPSLLGERTSTIVKSSLFDKKLLDVISTLPSSMATSLVDDQSALDLALNIVKELETPKTTGSSFLEALGTEIPAAATSTVDTKIEDPSTFAVSPSLSKYIEVELNTNHLNFKWIGSENLVELLNKVEEEEEKAGSSFEPTREMTSEVIKSSKRYPLKGDKGPAIISRKKARSKEPTMEDALVNASFRPTPKRFTSEEITLIEKLMYQNCSPSTIAMHLQNTFGRGFSLESVRAKILELQVKKHIPYTPPPMKQYNLIRRPPNLTATIKKMKEDGLPTSKIIRSLQNTYGKKGFSPMWVYNYVSEMFGDYEKDNFTKLIKRPEVIATIKKMKEDGGLPTSEIVGSLRTTCGEKGFPTLLLYDYISRL